MSLLLIVTIINALNALGSAVALATGDMRGLSLRVIIVQSVNLAFTILFVVYLQQGAYGSAVASLLAALIVDLTIKHPFCRRIAHTTFQFWFKEAFLPTVVPAIPPLIFCLAISYIYDISSWLSLFCVSSISGIMYILLIISFGFRQQDRLDIARLVDKVPTRIKPILRYLAEKK